MIKCMGSSVSPADREWHAICEMQLSCLAHISPLGNNMAISFCATTSISLSPSLSSCCLATMLVNVIPLVCDWLKGWQIHVGARNGGGYML